MKKTYHHTFPGGVSVQMEVEIAPDQDDAVVFVAWSPTFDPNFLQSVMEEYTTWINASMKDYGDAIGREIDRISI